MKRVPFSEKELTVVREIPGRGANKPATPIYDFPIPPREAFHAAVNKEPIWQISAVESAPFCPIIFPDYIARAFVVEATPLAREAFGGKDMFGVEWKYIEVADGSMVKPGKPLLADANEWEEKVVFPDIDAWDWEGSARANSEFLKDGFAHMAWIMNGFYERLISFMDFENAVVALIDEDQQEAVKALFEKLTDLYIRIVDKFVDHYDIDGFTLHDDWGSQKAPFFSQDVAREMIVPAMKRLTDHIHSRGKLADLHSCGHLEMQVPAIIDAGWDFWTPQTMNDTHMLYEKYGDRIILGVLPEAFPENAGEEVQKAAAAKFADKFCNPEKPAMLSLYARNQAPPIFRKELYRLSRIRFSG